MAGITLAQAVAKLALWMAADDAVANSQAYSMEGKALTRADSGLIMKNIIFWNNMVKELEDAGGDATMRVVEVLY